MIKKHPPAWWQSRGGIARCLQPLGWLYGSITVVRRWISQPRKLSVPVICVGNLTVGGTGKTPLVMALVNLCRDMGEEPHILSRGYGGNMQSVRVDPTRHQAAEVGDEPLLLAALAPTWVGRRRDRTAHQAISSGARLLLMDDGLQNTDIAQDIRLCVYDPHVGWGNGYLLPAGPLREFCRTGLKRCHAVFQYAQKVHSEGAMAMQVVQSGQMLEDCPGPRFTVHRVCVTRPQAQRHYIAFAGIGHPNKFFHMLAEEGFPVVGTYPFPDHHQYTASDLEMLRQQAQDADASLITTPKDWVKLPPEFQKEVISCQSTTQFHDKDAVHQWLQEQIQRARMKA